jgi:uncharacterized membrane protein
VAVATVRESVEIEAPAERVWAVVHEDFRNAPKWSHNLTRVEVLTPGPTRKGTILRYHLDTPGGAQLIEVEHTVYTPGKVCSGEMIEGPLKGKWKYSYAEREGVTKLTYQMDFEPNGWGVRIFFGIIERQIPTDLKKTLQSLKRYIESGKGPRAGKARG